MPTTRSSSGRNGARASLDLSGTFSGQCVQVVFDSPVLDNQIELSDKRPERSGFRDLRVPAAERNAHALVRIRAKDVVDAARVGLIREIELLGQPQVCEYEDHRASFVLAECFYVLGKVVSGMREPDAT